MLPILPENQSINNGYLCAEKQSLFSTIIEMHELSIAIDIINIVEESAKKSGAISVSLIELEIGQLSGVEIEALKMAMEVSLKGTFAEEAEIKIQFIEGEGRCEDCGNISTISDIFSICPLCGSFKMEISKGKELRVKSIDAICK